MAFYSGLQQYLDTITARLIKPPRGVGGSEGVTNYDVLEALTSAGERMQDAIEFVTETNSSAFIQASITQAQTAAQTANQKASEIAIDRIAVQNARSETLYVKSQVDTIKTQLENNVLDAELYQGTWNAATNTPALTTTPGANGHYREVTVPGTQSITGTSVDFAVGDKVKSNGTAWERVPANNLALGKVAVLEKKQYESNFVAPNLTTFDYTDGQNYYLGRFLKMISVTGDFDPMKTDGTPRKLRVAGIQRAPSYYYVSFQLENRAGVYVSISGADMQIPTGTLDPANIALTFSKVLSGETVTISYVVDFSIFSATTGSASPVLTETNGLIHPSVMAAYRLGTLAPRKIARNVQVNPIVSPNMAALSLVDGTTAFLADMVKGLDYTTTGLPLLKSDDTVRRLRFSGLAREATRVYVSFVIENADGTTTGINGADCYVNIAGNDLANMTNSITRTIGGYTVVISWIVDFTKIGVTQVTGTMDFSNAKVNDWVLLKDAIPKLMPELAAQTNNITYAKLAATTRKRLKGRNLLANYRMEGVGTYPDTYTFEKSGTLSAFNGLTASGSPNKFPVAKVNVQAVSGAAHGYAILYAQGANITALGHAGKQARLVFYFKTDVAIRGIYLRPKNGSTPQTAIFTNYTSQVTVGQVSLVKTNAFTLIDGTDVGYGIYVEVDMATYPNVAHVEISEVTLRLEEDGDIVGTELNEAREIARLSTGQNETQINALIASAILNPKNIALSLPEKVYAVQGKKLQIFKRSMMKAIDPDNYQLAVANSSYPNAKGNFYDDVYEYTAQVGDTSFPITFQLLDDNLAALSEATVTIVPTAKKTSPASPLRVLIHGDSFTAGDAYPIELGRMLTGSGGSPAADGLTNIQFVGTKKTETAVPREAISGKTYNFFLSDPTSPFYNPGTSTMDIGYYVTQNSIVGIDVAIIILGTNSHDSDAIISAHWQKFLDYNPSMKILVGARVLENPWGGWGQTALNAVASPQIRNAFGNVKAILDFNRRVEALTKTAPFLGKVHFVDILPTFDAENNVPYITVDANTRNAVATRRRGADNVHPAPSGYYQIADAMYAAFHAVVL